MLLNPTVTAIKVFFNWSLLVVNLEIGLDVAGVVVRQLVLALLLIENDGVHLVVAQAVAFEVKPEAGCGDEKVVAVWAVQK